MNAVQTPSPAPAPQPQPLASFELVSRNGAWARRSFARDAR